MSVELFCEGMWMGMIGINRNITTIKADLVSFQYAKIPQYSEMSLSQQVQLTNAIITMFNEFTEPTTTPLLPDQLADPKGKRLCRLYNPTYFMLKIHPYLSDKEQNNFRRVERLGSLLSYLMFEVYFSFQLQMALDFELPLKMYELYRKKVFGFTPLDATALMNGIGEEDFQFLKDVARGSYRIPERLDDTWIG